MKEFLRFIRLIPAFFELYKESEMEPEFIKFALMQYIDVMMEITDNRMSKLGYEAEEILRVMNNHHCERCKDDMCSNCKEMKQIGQWTTRKTQQHDGEWYCDQCDYEPTVFEVTPYCPNCGAMMELDK